MESEYAIPVLNKTECTGGGFAGTDWFTRIATSSVGCEVQVQVKNGRVYEGVLKSLSPQMDAVLEVTQKQDLGNNNIVPEVMHFNASDISFIFVVNRYLDTAVKDLTDGAVSKCHIEQIEKDLHQQAPDYGSENQTTGGGFAGDWFTHIAKSSVGCEVQVQVKNGRVYEGVLKSLSSQMDAVLQVKQDLGNSNRFPEVMHLNASEIASICTVNQCLDTSVKDLSDVAVSKYHVEQIEKDLHQQTPENRAMDVELQGPQKHDPRNKKRPPEVMHFNASEISSINAPKIDRDAAIKDHFTDGAITKSCVTKIDKDLHQLTPWEAEEDGEDFRFESQTVGWDPIEMFTTNEKRFGIRSTYDPSLSIYTTPLNKTDSKDFEKRKKIATKIANEIEGSDLYQQRIALENLVEDEEEKYSAVTRADKTNDEKEKIEDMTKEDRIQELLQKIQEINNKNEADTVDFKDQLKNLKDNYCREVNSIQTQLSFVKDENAHLKTELEKCQESQDQLKNLKDNYCREVNSIQTQLSFVKDENAHLKTELEKCQESQEVKMKDVEKEKVLDKPAKAETTTATQTEVRNEFECPPKKKERSRKKRLWQNFIGWFTACICQKQ